MSDEVRNAMPPIPMLLWCPECGERHIDVGKFAEFPHHTHACQGCGMVWRPAILATVGVQWLPGFKNDVPKRGTAPSAPEGAQETKGEKP